MNSQTIYSAFKERVTVHPGAPAIIEDDQILTYHYSNPIPRLDAVFSALYF